MPRRDSDRNLLFGINALQNDFITRDALIAAMAAWALEKHRSLGDILVERGALNADDRALLDQLLDRHLARHGNDPLASLAAMSSIGSVADDLRRSIADPEVLESLATVAPVGTADPFATRATIPPPPPSAGVRFRKVREHAAGNLGVVYVARDEELNREVALKEIKERNADHAQHQAKFLLEAEVTGGLEHPGIVPVYGLGHHDDGRPYYAMRFIRGKSLLDAIKRFHADESLRSDPGRRTLALQKLLRRFTDVCNAVAYAHSRGILHRDLKPDNVMVGKYGETLVVDWGLAKALGTSGDPSGTLLDPDDPLPEASLQPSGADSAEATQAGSLVGTPAYMSPEQAAGRLDLLGPASDVYGLGATLYHLLVGRPPIQCENLGDLLAKIQSGDVRRPRSLARWLDPALEAICLKAMALKPEARYGTPRALAEDLDRWIASEPVAAYTEPWTRRTRRWARKHRTFLATTTSIAAVGSLWMAWVVWERIERRRDAYASVIATIASVEQKAIFFDSGGAFAFNYIQVVEDAKRAFDGLESGGGSGSDIQNAKARIRAVMAKALEANGIRVLESLRKRSQKSIGWNNDMIELKTNKYFSESFSELGIDIHLLSVEQSAKRIRSMERAEELIGALDDWSAVEPATDVRRKLIAIAQAADSNGGRVAIREKVAKGDAAGLRRLGAGPLGGFAGEAEDRAWLIFDGLSRLGQDADLPILESLHSEATDDIRMNLILGILYLNANPPRLHDAIRCFTVAKALSPGSARPHFFLGNAYRQAFDLDSAVREYRKSILVDANYAMAHCRLGMALMEMALSREPFASPERGRLFREAVASLERGHNIGLEGNHWKAPSEQWVRDARRLVELEGKVTSILKAKITARDADERLALAAFCGETGGYAEAVRFTDEAFAEKPALADDLAKGSRYNAARAAALADMGEGKDEHPPEAATRIGLREKARGWLRADLSAWAKVLEVGDEPASTKVARTLGHWKADPDLAGIRDATALAKLPRGEREALRLLWADVEALKKKAEDGRG